MKKKTVQTALLLLIGLFLFAPIQALAQANTQSSSISPSPETPKPTPTPINTSNSFLTVSPPIRELELPKGSANSYQMSITNRSDHTVNLVLRASPFIASGQNGGVSVADEALAESQNWVIINPSLVTLAPKEQKNINYTIAIPQSAEPGGFYFAVTALLAGKTQVSGSLANINTGAAVDLNVASLNLITIEGPVNYSAQIAEFSIPKALFEYGPVPFTSRIFNLSNVHIKPVLEINVKNTLGLEKPQTIHLQMQNILPQAKRKYESELGGKWHFGRYSATLNGLYGDGQMLNYTLFFWILPWKIITAIILAIAIIVLLITSIRHQLNDKKLLEEELKKIKENRSNPQE